MQKQIKIQYFIHFGPGEYGCKSDIVLSGDIKLSECNVSVMFEEVEQLKLMPQWWNKTKLHHMLSCHFRLFRAFRW